MKLLLLINDNLGFNGVISEDLIVTQAAELVKQAGYSCRSRYSISYTFISYMVKSSKDITTEFLGQVKALKLQNNLAINEKNLLESIAKTI